MAKKSKRVLSVLLTLIMILGLLPTSVFAYDNSWQVGSYVGYDAATGQKTGEQYATAEEATQVLEKDGVTMQKNISAAGTENLFNIDLIVTTQEQLEEIPMSPDAAVVLVIDSSYSMNYNDDGCDAYCKKNNLGSGIYPYSGILGTSYRYMSHEAYHENSGSSYFTAWPVESERRITKAKAAASDFVDDFTSEAGDAKRLVSVVSFNGDAEVNQGWTESADAAKTAISRITTDSSTNIEDGLQKAYDLLGRQEVQGIKSKYVILLTDGAPTTSNQRGSRSTRDYAEDAAAVAQKIRVDRQATLYTLAYAVADENLYGNVTVGQWLENDIASKDCAYNAVNGDQISISLDDIMETISKLMQAWRVTDPMGTYMKNPTITSRKDNDVVSVGSDGTILWNLWLDTPEVSGSSPKTYTYKLSYQVELDTTKEGFAEGTYYETNKPTSLKYAVDLVNDDGSLNVNANIKTAYFNIPTVQGEIPEVPYTIEYYVKDKETGEYPETPTDSTSDTAKMWTTVSAPPNYATKYGENYRFVEGATSIKLTSTESNVLKLYYDPIPANVIVYHYVSTVNHTDDGDVYSEPELRNFKEYGNQYKGDEFTVPEADFLDSETYTLEESLTDKNGDTYETDTYTDVTLPEGTTTINIYYTTEGDDQRTPVDYEIHYWYREDSWAVNEETGKYEIVTGTYKENAGAEVVGRDYHGVTIDAPDKSGTDYTLDEDRTGATSMTLTKNQTNRLDIYYYKAAPDAPDAETATLTIVHKYFEKVVDENGEDTQKLNLVDTKYELGSADSGETVYVGETYTASVWPYGYTLQTPEDQQQVEITEAGKNYTITMEYVKDTREPVEIVINHYYTTYTWTVDPETGDGEYVETGSEELLGVHATGIHYVGEKFTPTQIPNGYEYVSGGDEKILEAGTNTFDIYYEIKIGSEDDEADVTINHIYRTYRSYVDEDGNVIVRELVDVETEPESKYYGTKGETITAEKQEKDDFTFVSADTEDLKVTLRGKGGQYNLYYEYVDNQLGEQVPVMVQPVYKTYTTYVNAEGQVVTELTNTENGTQVKLGDFYVGQKATALAANYGKTGFAYDADDKQNTADLTLKASADSTENVITVVYSHTDNNLGLRGVVLVNNVYTTLTTYIDADGNLQTSESSFTSSNTTYGPYYMGQYFDTTGKGTQLSGYVVDTREGITQPAASVKVTQDGQLVTFYWLQEVDHTVSATVKVVHHYTLKDSNPNVGTSSWVVGADDEPLTGYFAGQYYLPGYDFQGGSFSAENVTDVVPSGATTDPGVKLVAGLNEIHIYYEKSVDSRVSTTVKVIHNYYKDADALAAGTTEASYEENVSKMEADTYTATLRTENSGLVYNFNSATPDNYTITVAADAESNVITINYVRADATYTVVHEYYSNGSFVGSTESSFGGKVGDTVSADDIDKITSFDGRTYRYRSADPETMVLVAGDENVMTLRYTRTSGGGGGGGGSTDPDPDPDPGTDIEDPDVPTTDLPDVPGETTDPVEEPVEIEEPEVPMAEAPETGDSNFAYLHLLSLASALGLVALFLSDKRSKKHRDEA